MSRAWKDLERRVCRALGGERSGPTGGSDCVHTPYAVEVKRSTRPGPPVLAKWIQQARTQGQNEGKPWILVTAGHYDRRPVATVDFLWLVEQLGGRVEYMETTEVPAPPVPVPDTGEDDE